jgi:serine/threonine-protein kinase
MSFEVGEMIGDYRVVGLIGAGGMGRIFKVQNIITDRVEAMKILLPDLRQDTELAERFMREIRVQASLQHPNIASLHTARREGNQLLMFMEFVEGATLDALLRPGPPAVGQGVHYIIQILDALIYAHSCGVVHRDIKPANIMVMSNGVVKLLDFGIARAAANEHLTGTGVAVGSLAYMSPEQVTGAPVDARSDIYSVGVCLYEVTTGVRPIRGASSYDVMKAHLHQAPQHPRELRPALPAQIEDAILKAMAKAPADRFQSAEQFRTVLEPFSTAPAFLRRDTPLPSRAAAEPTVLMTAALQTPVPAPSGERTTLSFQGVDAATLHMIEHNLAQWVGPIARHLLKKASATAPGLPELCRTVAENIPEEANRHKFLAQCEKELRFPRLALSVSHTPSYGTPSQGTQMLATPTPKPPAFDAGVLDRAKKHLAAFVGPMAKMLVDRAAKRSASIDDLYRALEEEIPAGDLQKFRAKRPD